MPAIPQPPTAQLYENGYDKYLRLVALSNRVQSKLWKDLGVRLGMHVEHDAVGSVVVKFHLLCLSPKDHMVSSLIAAALVSGLDTDMVLVQRMHDQDQTDTRIAFDHPECVDSDESDCQNICQICSLLGTMIMQMYSKPDLEAIANRASILQTAASGFMKKVTSLTDRGFSSNYEAKFSDGSYARFTMPTHLGEQIKPGDWLLSSPQGDMTHVAARSVN